MHSPAFGHARKSSPCRLFVTGKGDGAMAWEYMLLEAPAPFEIPADASGVSGLARRQAARTER